MRNKKCTVRSEYFWWWKLLARSSKLSWNYGPITSD